MYIIQTCRDVVAYCLLHNLIRRSQQI